jgi:hypothetical protein
MYEATELFKSAISQKNRELRIKATIDGTVYSDTDVQDCSIEESILTGEEFKFGSATASRLELTLLNMDESLTAKSFEDKTVHIELGVLLDKFHQPFEYASMGYFIVEEASKDNNLIKLTGYDKMIYFEKPYVSNLAYPATLLQILQEVCTQAGVQLESTSFLNSDYSVNEMPNLENSTLRLAVEHISELACSYACINRMDKLELKTFSDSTTSINADNYYSMKLSEYEYGPINHVVINNNGTIKEAGLGTNTIEIKDNIFGFNPSDQLINNIFNEIKDFKFKPFTSSWQGNPLTAPGDIINVTYKNGDTYKSFIANQKFTFSTGLKCDITTNARTTIQSQYETKGPLTNELEKAKKEYRSKFEQTDDKITFEVERIDSSIATLQIQADNITLSVQSLDERMGSAEASLVIQADNISSKVSQTDYNGNTIASLFNQTATTILLQADKIELDGIVRVNKSLNIGSPSEYDTKTLWFNNAANLSATGFGYGGVSEMKFGTSNLNFEYVDDVFFRNTGIKTRINGDLDFQYANVSNLYVTVVFG